MNGWEIFTASLTAFLGFQIGFEVATRLYMAGFHLFGSISGVVAILVSALGVFIWLRIESFRLLQIVVIAGGLIGGLSGILKAILD